MANQHGDDPFVIEPATAAFLKTDPQGLFTPKSFVQYCDLMHANMKMGALQGKTDCYPPCRATRRGCVCNDVVTASPAKAPEGCFGDALAAWLVDNLTDYDTVLEWLQDLNAKNEVLKKEGGAFSSPGALRHWAYTEWARINGARGVRVRVGGDCVVWCISDVPSALCE